MEGNNLAPHSFDGIIIVGPWDFSSSVWEALYLLKNFHHQAYYQTEALLRPTKFGRYKGLRDAIRLIRYTPGACGESAYACTRIDQVAHINMPLWYSIWGITPMEKKITLAGTIIHEALHNLFPQLKHHIRRDGQQECKPGDPICEAGWKVEQELTWVLQPLPPSYSFLWYSFL